MTELERAIVALGRELDVPAAPDLAPRVRARIARTRRRRRLLAVAIAAAVAAVAVALAVPGSRAAILRLFHLRGVEVRLVETLPPVHAGPLGRRIALGDAAFPLRLLDGREPDAVYAAQGGYWLRYPGALLFELQADGAILKKVAAAEGDVAYVSVGGRPGIWIGAGHVVYLPGGAGRPAGRTLLWQDGALTLRLEADVAKEQAIALAERVR